MMMAINRTIKALWFCSYVFANPLLLVLYTLQLEVTLQQHSNNLLSLVHGQNQPLFSYYNRILDADRRGGYRMQVDIYELWDKAFFLSKFQCNCINTIHICITSTRCPPGTILNTDTCRHFQGMGIAINENSQEGRTMQ